MSDQTFGIPVRDLDAARKRAYALKTEANNLGYPVGLAHTYELLGTAWGYKNWATVKSLLEKPSVDCSIPIGVVENHPDQTPVRLPLSECMNHVEIIAPGERCATQDFVMAMVSSLIPSGAGMFFAYTGAQRECIEEVRGVAATAGREDAVRIINLDLSYRDRKGCNLDIYEMLDRDGLADLLFEGMLDRFGKGDPLYHHRLRCARALTSSLAGIPGWLSGTGDDQMTGFREWLPLEALCDLAKETIPDDVRLPLLEYFSLQGIDVNNPNIKSVNAAHDAHNFHLNALDDALLAHVEMQKGALSRKFDVAQSVRDGEIIVVTLPHDNDITGAEGAVVRALLRLIGKAVAENEAPSGKPFVTVLEGAHGYLRDGYSGRFLENAKAASSPAFVVSERPLALPGLRGSAAIHVHAGLNRALECVLVTDRERTEFTFPR
ncbi:hypothetical protein O9X98_14485 [Agrobacterium salinitolerans]|nr:hypothetical protein [Agrobacterium salinitolerans]